MKSKYCPFVFNIEQVIQYVYDYDENGNNTTGCEQKLVGKQSPALCKQRECAMWVRGRCRRK